MYFRFADLATVPAEMVSDHAEKLLDVVDILNGNYSIFFPRNTGREALQFYLIDCKTALGKIIDIVIILLNLFVWLTKYRQYLQQSVSHLSLPFLEARHSYSCCC